MNANEDNYHYSYYISEVKICIYYGQNKERHF